jgi:hypothetical protein
MTTPKKPLLFENRRYYARRLQGLPADIALLDPSVGDASVFHELGRQLRELLAQVEGVIEANSEDWRRLGERMR